MQSTACELVNFVFAICYLLFGIIALDTVRPLVYKVYRWMCLYFYSDILLFMKRK